MPITCAKATESYLAGISSEFECESVGSTLRIVTPYPYPDQDLIEVFIEEPRPGIIRVSDFGETLRTLYSQGFDVSTARKRRQMADAIAAGSGVQIVHGELTKEGRVEDVGEIIFDVIVAARGVSDLVLTSRSYEPATFQEEVAHFLDDRNVRYVTGTTVVGRSGKEYSIPFHLPDQNKYVETVSPNQASGLQPVFNRVLRVWVDVNGSLTKESKVSILNDVDFRWGQPEIALLGNVSRIGFWSRPDELAETITSNGN